MALRLRGFEAISKPMFLPSIFGNRGVRMQNTISLFDQAM